MIIKAQNVSAINGTCFIRIKHVFCKFSAAVALDDESLGFFVHFPAWNWQAIVINMWVHNALSDSFAIVLDKLFNITLGILPNVSWSSLVIVKFAQLIIVDLHGILLFLFGDRDKIKINSASSIGSVMIETWLWALLLMGVVASLTVFHLSPTS